MQCRSDLAHVFLEDVAVLERVYFVTDLLRDNDDVEFFAICCARCDPPVDRSLLEV